MSEQKVRPRRSFIFTPGLKPEMFPKALACGTDIVCVELEDGIAPKDKVKARHLALSLFETPQEDDGVERILRINSMRERVEICDGRFDIRTRIGEGTCIRASLPVGSGSAAWRLSIASSPDSSACLRLKCRLSCWLALGMASEARMMFSGTCSL